MKHQKIILATQTINWLSYRLSNITDELYRIPDNNIDEVGRDIVTKSIKEHDVIMQDIVNKLTIICNDLGDYMNSNDCVDRLDDSVTKEAMDILNGKIFQ
jgi:hypothetical protein